jgi:hypothetical protein
MVFNIDFRYSLEEVSPDSIRVEFANLDSEENPQQPLQPAYGM